MRLIADRPYNNNMHWDHHYRQDDSKHEKTQIKRPKFEGEELKREELETGEHLSESDYVTQDVLGGKQWSHAPITLS